MSTVLSYLELSADGDVPRASTETLTFARKLAEAHDADLEVVVLLDPSAPGSDTLQRFGVARVHVVEHEHLDAAAAPAAIAESLVQLHRGLAPIALVGSGDDHSAEVFAHLGARLDLPLVANVTAIEPAEGGWELTRIRWGGVLLEDAHLDAEVALVTAAPHQTPAAPATTPGAATVARFAPDLADVQLHLTRVQEREGRGGGISLATAPVVIAGGRGVGSAEGFGILEELAELLGGAVGCSRVATNNGWRSHNDQVGQTGTRVAPDLYIACGISGATQHWVGCMSAKRILAINTDAEAPMVTRADDAVLGDLHELLPAVVEQVRARRGR